MKQLQKLYLTTIQVQLERLYPVLEDDDGSVNATCYFNFISNITRRASPYDIIENVVTETSLRNRGLGNELIRHALRCFSKIEGQTAVETAAIT